MASSKGISGSSHRQLLSELIAKGGATVRCAGRSMEPTVLLGQEVRIVPCDRARVGEVILFETRGGDYVLHRVVFAFPGFPWMVHLGDAGSEKGPGLVHKNRVMGKAALPRCSGGPRSVWLGMKRLVLAVRNVTRSRP